VIGRNSVETRDVFSRENGVHVMPMLFYLPMILWLGMFGVVESELRPVRTQADEP